MANKEIKLTPSEVVTRILVKADPFGYTYKNPFLLATLYYTEGKSTYEIADLLNCHDRTVRRYMNYFGFKRFTGRFSQLVEYHGIEHAMKIEQPSFMPLGRYND